MGGVCESHEGTWEVCVSHMRECWKCVSHMTECKLVVCTYKLHEGAQQGLVQECQHGNFSLTKAAHELFNPPSHVNVPLSSGCDGSGTALSPRCSEK